MYRRIRAKGVCVNKKRARRRRARRIRAALLTLSAALILTCVGLFVIPKLTDGDRPVPASLDPASAEEQAQDDPTPQPDESPALAVTPNPEEEELENTPEEETAEEPETTDEPEQSEQEAETGGEEPDEPEPDATPAPARPQAAEEPVSLPLSGLIIGIDPGHQSHPNYEKEAVAPGSSETKMKVSGGTAGVSTRIPEYVVVLDVGLQLRDCLEALGAEVVMTREINDVDLSNQDRARICNDAGCDLVLRLHCNGAEDKSVNGISLFIRATGQGAEEAFEAAKILLPAMLEATGAKDFRIHKSDTYTGLNWSVPPSILVEMGFMSNPEEDKKLCDPAYQALLVDGMVNGIAEYFGRDITDASGILQEPAPEIDLPPLDTDNYVE